MLRLFFVTLKNNPLRPHPRQMFCNNIFYTFTFKEQRL